jgi:hypothetical protein
VSHGTWLQGSSTCVGDGATRLRQAVLGRTVAMSLPLAWPSHRTRQVCRFCCSPPGLLRFVAHDIAACSISRAVQAAIGGYTHSCPGLYCHSMWGRVVGFYQVYAGRMLELGGCGFSGLLSRPPPAVVPRQLCNSIQVCARHMHVLYVGGQCTSLNTPSG